MITEDYVSFETAKLLKEKGFDDFTCHSYFYKNGDIEEETRYEGDFGRPTLQMAVKWLRKEHNLAISTSFTIDGWRSYVSQIKLDSEGFIVDVIDGIDDGNIPNCDTYEEACEEAIKYCLENLI